jgi:2-dehydropantoate 2-reductase
MPMRIIIYGAGAIGSVLGGHLFRHGYAVKLVGNAEHMKAVKSHGLNLVTAKERYVLPIPVAESASELVPFHKDDLVLLCVKSQHTLKCLGQLKNAGAPNTIPVFCCQNSIWNESIATRVFNRIYGVMLFVDAIFLSPGEVINPITGRYGFIEIGCYPHGSDALCKEIARALRSSGFSTIVNEHVMKSKGAKCLLNLSNALHAITNGKGDLNQFERELRREAIRVWSLAGIELEDLKIFKKRCREYSGKLEIPEGYENLSRESSVSSWQSLARRTGNIESEQLNGDVVTLGQLLGIKTPYNNLVWHIADGMARNKEKPGKYTADELARMVQNKQTG